MIQTKKLTFFLPISYVYLHLLPGLYVEERRGHSNSYAYFD